MLTKAVNRFLNSVHDDSSNYITVHFPISIFAGKSPQVALANKLHFMKHKSTTKLQQLIMQYWVSFINMSTVLRLKSLLIVVNRSDQISS